MTQTWYYNTSFSEINLKHKLDMGKDTPLLSKAFEIIFKVLIVVFSLLVISIINFI